MFLPKRGNRGNNVNRDNFHANRGSNEVCDADHVRHVWA
jgi:hypothetical protein